jgi:ABC-type multidrug transport system ATPase subunit
LRRLGIARALLKDAPIIVLDEATSALDTEAELEIQRALAAVMKGRTVLAIAHRLSTVAKFDKLVVLREGRIVEQGTPAELRRRRGLFDRMCRLQEEGPVRCTRLITVDFPAPDGPTIPTRCPGSMRKVKPRNTSRPPGYEKSTFSNAMLPPR